MKRTTIFSLFCASSLLLPFMLLATGCLDCRKADSTDASIHDPKNGSDWAGVYSGEIPSASGTGIDVTITLNADSTYVLRYRYLGRAEGDFTVAGKFSRSEGGTRILLDAKGIPPHYRIGKGALIQLDMNGEAISGKLADAYVLGKRGNL